MNADLESRRPVTAFNPDPQHDLLWEIPEGIVGWSENMFFQAWDDTKGIGIFTHIGRVREDPTLWRGCLVVYLGGKRLIVHRSYGRSVDRRGPMAGELRIVCEQPGKRWQLSFDGVGEASDSSSAAHGLLGAGSSRPLKIELTFQSNSSTYDLFAARSMQAKNSEFSHLHDVAHLHHEQAFLYSGFISFDGAKTPLSGCGFRDHSVGARDLSGFGGNILFYGSTPGGRVIQGLRNVAPDGSTRMNSAFQIENGQGELLELVDAPGLERVSDEIGPFAVTFRRSNELLTITGETLHSAALTIHRPNDWSLGADLTGGNDPLIIVETPCRIHWPDGEVGYGNLERNFPRSKLQIAQAA